MEHLYAPWRMTYIRDEANRPTAGCPFCAARDDQEDPQSLVAHRGQLSFVVLNKYPYITGHSLILPRRHLSDIGELTSEELLDLNETVRLLIAAMRRVFKPHGFNVGLNLGHVAGAGLPGHLHYHVVPRWNGDHNFMQVLADTHVLPETLPVTRRKIADEIANLLAGK